MQQVEVNLQKSREHVGEAIKPDVNTASLITRWSLLNQRTLIWFLR